MLLNFRITYSYNKPNVLFKYLTGLHIYYEIITIVQIQPVYIHLYIY